MNKFRLLNAFLFIVIAAMMVLAYMTHVNSKNTHGLHTSLSEIGHHLIESRDSVVNRYSLRERKNYEITQSLVELEIAAENLCTDFKQSIWFSFTPTKTRVQNIVAQFDGKVRDATQTLDMLVGVQVANQYEMHTLHNIYKQQF
ncbi:hybrid sensor histidine kinase/response regulator, partial [Vibrio owensii]